MKHEKFKTDNVELNEYIEQLEKDNDSYGSSNTKRLMRTIDQMAGKISIDIEKFIGGETEIELPEKFIENFIKMIDKAPKLKNFIDISDAVFNPKKVFSEEITTTNTILEETITAEKEIFAGNIFEETQRKIQAKLNGK